MSWSPESSKSRLNLCWEELTWAAVAQQHCKQHIWRWTCLLPEFATLLIQPCPYLHCSQWHMEVPRHLSLPFERCAPALFLRGPSRKSWEHLGSPREAWIFVAQKNIGWRLVMAQCKTHTSCVQCTALKEGEESFSWGPTAQQHPSNLGLTNCSTNYSCYKVGWRVPASTEVLLSIFLGFKQHWSGQKGLFQTQYFTLARAVQYFLLLWVFQCDWLRVAGSWSHDRPVSFWHLFVQWNPRIFSLFFPYVLHSVLSLWHWNPSRCWPWCIH